MYKVLIIKKNCDEHIFDNRLLNGLHFNTTVMQ